MNVKTKLVIVISVLIAASVSITIAHSLLSDAFTLPSSGTVATVSVKGYSDAECTTLKTSYSFGVVPPGTSGEDVIYVRNEGTVPVVLSMTISNPSVAVTENQANYRWDKEGEVLGAGASVGCTLTVLVLHEIAYPDFSADVTITGTEQT